MLKNVTIMGPIAIGGQLWGPSIQSMILEKAPRGAWDVYSRAVATGVQAQVQFFCQRVTVPRLSWYPRFARWPAPIAPPMANDPTPLMTITSAASGAFKESELKAAIVRAFTNPRPACAEQVAKAIGDGLGRALFPWLSATLVRNVMGGGPVPSYAPPHVPFGPVLGGMGNQLPGGMG